LLYEFSLPADPAGVSEEMRIKEAVRNAVAGRLKGKI
jgi:hypothetical protein